MIFNISLYIDKTFNLLYIYFLFLTRIPDPPITVAPADDIKKAWNLLLDAKKPLVVIGKGAAYGRAENEIRQFIDSTNLPFISTPMGK